MSAYPRQGEIYRATLDPTIGREIRKRRPMLIVWPDEMNRNLATVIAAPVTSKKRAWPTTRCAIPTGANHDPLRLNSS